MSLGNQLRYTMDSIVHVLNKVLNKACFKRRATAVLSWLDFSSTTARQEHDLVSDVEFNSVE